METHSIPDLFLPLLRTAASYAEEINSNTAELGTDFKCISSQMHPSLLPPLVGQRLHPAELRLHLAEQRLQAVRQLHHHRLLLLQVSHLDGITPDAIMIHLDEHSPISNLEETQILLRTVLRPALVRTTLWLDWNTHLSVSATITFTMVPRAPLKASAACHAAAIP